MGGGGWIPTGTYETKKNHNLFLTLIFIILAFIMHNLHNPFYVFPIYSFVTIKQNPKNFNISKTGGGKGVDKRFKN